MDKLQNVNLMRSLRLMQYLACAALFLGVPSGFAQQITPTPAGLVAQAGGVTMEVTALRDDILGVFLDNTWRTNFDFGASDPNRYTFGALNGPLDYYFIYGPEPKQVVMDWAWLTGPTPLPPL